jgi:hypothetical protein
MNRKAIVAAVAALWLVGCDSSSKDAPPAPPPRASAVSSAVPAVALSTNAPAPPKKQGQKGVVKSSIRQLPGIDELYAQAKERGVATDLYKTVQVKAKNFDSMGPAERAIEVGMYLASLAIASSDPSKDIPLPMLEDAQKAVNSLSPPAEAKKYVSEMVGEVKKGLKGDDLRKAIDRMMAQGIPLMENDPAFATTARLLRLGAYLRTMSLLAKSLAGATDAGKLLVLSQSPDHEFHLQTVGELSDDMKKEALVKAARDALDKSKDAVLKPAPGPEDAKVITAAMATFAG